MRYAACANRRCRAGVRKSLYGRIRGVGDAAGGLEVVAAVGAVRARVVVVWVVAMVAGWRDCCAIAVAFVVGYIRSDRCLAGKKVLLKVK